MPRPEKVQAVADIKERLEGANGVFLAEFAGLSVTEQQELRRGLREVGSEFKVVKMTLARLAMSEIGHEEMFEWMDGPTGLTFADSDAASTAKVLREFSKDHEALVVKGGLLGDEVLPPERVSELAEIEPRDVLLARIAGAFEAPMSKLAGLLQALPRDLARMMGQLVDKKTEAGDDSMADAQAEEAPEEEAPEEADAVAEAAQAPAAAAGESAPDAGTDAAEASDESDEATPDDDSAAEAEEE
jgi:large subunit ribosomal protein L10